MAKYPDIVSGSRVTTRVLSSMLPEIIYKATTQVVTGTTYTDDTELQYAAEASATYRVEFFLQPAAILTEDVKTLWSVPSGASGFKGVIGPGSDANDGAANNIAMRCGVHNFDTGIPYSGVRNNNTFAFTVIEQGIVTTDDAGTIGIQWAQVSAGSSSGVHMLAGSLMRVTRLA